MANKMKMTKQQLKELIRYITEGVLKEYSLMSSTTSTDSTDPGTSNDDDKPNDAMTAYEKSKAEREARKNRQDAVRTAQIDLDSTRKQSDYFTQQEKQNKLDIAAKQRKLQALKGASDAAVVPAGGTIAENRKKK